MAFYDDMRDIAEVVLAEFKQGTVYYVALTPGDGPADNPGPATETQTKINAAVRGVQWKYTVNNSNSVVAQASNVVASDLQLSMAVNGNPTPDMNGFILMNGKRFKIVQVMGVPAADPVAWVVIFR